MKTNFLLISTIVSFAILGLLHFIAESFYFYWTVFWFDIMMHFLGGISVSLLTLWLISRSKSFENSRNSFLAKLFTVLVAVLIVSFFWEVLEHLTGTAKALEGYILDTTTDTIFALLGATTSTYLVSPRIT